MRKLTIIVGVAAFVTGCMVQTGVESSASMMREQQSINRERETVRRERAGAQLQLEILETQRSIDAWKTLATYKDAEIDFLTEAAWAENVFATRTGEKYDPSRARVCADEYATRIRSEYARYLRFMASGGVISNLADRTEIFIGAFCVGRPKVAAWAYIKGMNVNALSRFDRKKRSILMWALLGNDNETVRCALELHPNILLVDAEGNTALHYAVRRGDMPCIDVLCKIAPVLINSKNNHGETPIYDSITFGRVDIGRFFLAHQARLKIVDHEGYSPFAFACKRSEMDFVILFEKAGIQPSVDDFAIAVEYGDIEIVKWFVDKRFFSVIDKKIVSLENAGRIKSPDVRDYLLRRGLK